MFARQRIHLVGRMTHVDAHHRVGLGERRALTPAGIFVFHAFLACLFIGELSEPPSITGFDQVQGNVATLNAFDTRPVYRGPSCSSAR